MYRFSFVETVGGRAVEVTREMFLEVIRREKIKSICRQIADEMASSSGEESAKTIGRLKRQLPAFCWHAWFDGGKRKNYTAHPSGLLMIDLDHIVNPLQLWSQLKDESIKSGLLVAHITPSTKGLRLVFPVPQGMDIVKAQSYYSKKLKLKNVDACTKDLARLSFCVPEDYFLHISDMLFGETASDPLPASPLKGEERYQPNNETTKSPNDQTTKQPNDETTKQPNDQTTKQPNHQTTKRPNHQTTKRPNHQTTKQRNHQTTKRPNHHASLTRRGERG